MTAQPATFDIKEAIRTVVEGQELNEYQANAAMDAIMRGEVTGSQIGALVTGLRMKGETTSEIAGFARAMRSHALNVEIDHDDEPLLDTCGTGGDHSNTFNISTTATFVIAAAGVRIAKHGNRAASSLCGSADLLEAFGVQVELTPAQVEESVRRVGVGFMFAPAFHPAMRFVGPARKEMGIRTIFNILGPLANPAGTRHQLIGVGHPGIAGKMAEVLSILGSSHAVLVHSEEGLDEIGIQGASYITEWDERNQQISTYSVVPEDFGLERGAKDELVGGSAADNVRITRSILNGELGARRSIVLMNAGAGIYAANASASFADGVAMASHAIDSGRAMEKLQQLVAVTRDLVAQAKEAVV